ncbi:MAG: hypothetical protein M0Q54_06560, partial [Pigmentiphaga sp.]|nr:hypothetical protein [Pigmentiphaga sp.]
TLPEALEEQFVDAVEEREDPEMMEQLNSFQRVRLRREKAASEEDGLKRGRLEGSAGILQAQLLHKFGPLPAWAEARIRSADTDVLQAWALKALDAKYLETVFEE